MIISNLGRFRLAELQRELGFFLTFLTFLKISLSYEMLS